MKEEKKFDIPSVELKPTEELSEKDIDDIVSKRNQILAQLGYKVSEDGTVIKQNNNNIIYFKLDSGVILKIDRQNFTCYRFNAEKNEWNEDSRLFTEYEQGNLRGVEFEVKENYPIGEKFEFGRHL